MEIEVTNIQLEQKEELKWEIGKQRFEKARSWGRSGVKNVFFMKIHNVCTY